ncbi:MAG: hypothetical protein H6918_01170 [Sphingomonadaceae bacterium]|nr:hypothetical protein [Sphingomonadaceae bacterium]
MKSCALGAMACGLLVASPAAADNHEAADAPQLSKGEQRLAKMLEGREAGKPESCIYTRGNGSLQVIDKTAIVYRSGKTVWVNRTQHPESLDDSDYMVIQKFGDASRLCKLDNVTTRSRTGNFFSGVIFLEDFVPYRKVDKDEG